MGPDAPRQARRVLSELLEGWPADALYDVKLLVSELVTNSVLHSGLGPHDEVLLEASRLDDGAVRVRVIDSGSGFAIDMGHLAGGSAGLGLRFVDQLSRRWGIESIGDAGTCVWFEVSPN